MRVFSMALALALGITLMQASIASARNRGQVQNASYGSMQDMIDRIESLEGMLVGYNSPAGCRGSDFQCGGRCAKRGGCAKCCNDRSAIYFAAELVVAKPHFEDEYDPGFLDEARYDYDVSPRIIGGFSNARGLGGRVRYWQWNHNSSPGPAAEAPFRLYNQALDLETTMKVRLSSIDLTLFGGGRYGRVEHNTSDGDGVTFEGFGPTLGVDLLAPIRCKNLSLLAGFRYSTLFGHSSFGVAPRGEDDLMHGVDTQLGVQYSHSVANGSLNVKAYVESQLWDGATQDPDNDLDDVSTTDDVFGFLAYVFGVEYVY